MVAQWLHVRLLDVVRSSSLVRMSLKCVKSSLPSTLVMASARCSVVETGTILIIPFSTCSLKKWWRMSMCFVRRMAVAFSAILMVARLSSYTTQGFSTGMRMVFNNMYSHISSLTARLSAMYSASQVQVDMKGNGSSSITVSGNLTPWKLDRSASHMEGRLLPRYNALLYVIRLAFK